MMLAVGDALVEASRAEDWRGAAAGALSRAFVRWYDDPDNNRAPGNTCLRACEGIIAGHGWMEATIMGSKGCGANMRVQPVGLLDPARFSDADVAGLAQLQAAITHGHPTGLAAADLTARAIRLLVSGTAPAELPGALRRWAVSQREVYHAGWLGALWRRSRAPAAFGLVAVCAWVGVGAVGKSEAIDAARRHAVEQGIAAVALDAIPRPASPFNWTAVIDDGERFHTAHINTRRTDVLEAGSDDNLIRRLSAHYRPVTLAQWQVRERFGNGDDGAVQAQVRAVWSAPDFAFFRWFAMFPVLDSVGGAAGGACISFRDLRFETPGRDNLPFRYGLCENGAGWSLVERTMAGWRRLSGR
jgi:hypothetical protein